MSQSGHAYSTRNAQSAPLLAAGMNERNGVAVGKNVRATIEVWLFDEALTAFMTRSIIWCGLLNTVVS
jgi:hypothetical protein